MQAAVANFKDWEITYPGNWGVDNPLDLDNGFYGIGSKQPLDDELMDKIAWMIERGAPPVYRFWTPAGTEGPQATVVVFAVVDVDGAERYQEIDATMLGVNPAAALHSVAFGLRLALPPGNNRAYPGYAVRKATKEPSIIGKPVVPQSAVPPTEFEFASGADASLYPYGYVHKVVEGDGVVRYMRINHYGHVPNKTGALAGMGVVPGWTTRIDPTIALDLT